MAVQMSDDPLPHIKQYSKVKYLPSANVYMSNTLHNLLFLILKSNSVLRLILRLKGIAHIHLADERYNVFKCCFYVWYILVAMVT